MRLMCTCDHHPHRHETDTNITRQPNGTWTVDGEELPSWPTDPDVALGNAELRERDSDPADLTTPQLDTELAAVH